MDIIEVARKGGLSTKAKYPDHFKNLTKKRFEGMSKEQISEYMRKVRAGTKIDSV